MTRAVRNPAFDIDDFLSNYWQKKPIVIKNFLPGFSDPVSAEELAGLACEEFVESRVIRQTQANQWDLQHGPFAEDYFPQLPDSDWTLLVQAVDQWLPEVADLRAAFDFLPSWRIDDVMISFAAPGGGVGPHFDYYDVFLIQGSGQRRWCLGGACQPDTEIQNQGGVSLLSSFETTEEHLLNPGDVLYIPPQFAHWGTATSASLCYSVGFRSPSLAEMIEGYSDRVVEKTNAGQRFTDPEPRQPEHAGEILATALRPSLEAIQNLLADSSEFARWFGSRVTEPKYPELQEHPDEEIGVESVASAARLTRSQGSRFAFMELAAESTLLLFVDGDCHSLAPHYRKAVSYLCDTSIGNIKDIPINISDETWLQTLTILVNRGSIQLG